MIASARQQDRVVLDALEALKTNGIPPMYSHLIDWRRQPAVMCPTAVTSNGI